MLLPCVDTRSVPTPIAPIMSVAIVHTRAISGVRTPEVTVEVHIAGGLPGIYLVGLPDTEGREARDRVRAAM